MSQAAAGEPLAANVPAVVVVTHDTREEALGCLASAQRAGARELVLVDSGSADGTAEAVRSVLPEVRVLPLANVGFGRAANADVRFEPDSLRRLEEELLADPSLAAVGPQVVYPDGSLQASARRLPDLKTAIGHALLSRVHEGNRFTRRYRALDTDPTLPRDVDWLSGCALALRREAFQSVGGFDPGYFLYVEDVDLCVRLQAAGWRLRYAPTARVTHRVGASTGQRRARALAHHARSLDRFYGLHVARTPPTRLLWPFVRLGLAGWVLATLVWERVERWTGVSRSTTGERGGPA